MEDESSNVSEDRSNAQRIENLNFFLGFELSVQGSNAQKIENLPQALAFERQKIGINQRSNAKKKNPEIALGILTPKTKGTSVPTLRRKLDRNPNLATTRIV